MEGLKKGEGLIQYQQNLCMPKKVGEGGYSITELKSVYNIF